MSKPDGERYTIAVDFDGVLHSYSSPWVDEQTIPDPPVPGAIEWLAQMYDKFTVVIFTTRGRTTEGQQAVHAWLIKHGLDPRIALDLAVDWKKPPALVYLDDRAMRFEGTFPTAQQIHAARPWNKPAAVAR